MSTTLLIADDHRLFRQGLAALLREQADWEVVGEAGDGEVVLAVSDDGKGFVRDDVSRKAPGGGGSGLFSLRERLALFGGRLSIATNASGTTATVRMPLARAGERRAAHDGNASEPQAATRSPAAP